MAKPPRSCFVHKKTHIYRYLPRRNDQSVDYDYEKMNARPEQFEDRLENPPKLWLAWIYKQPAANLRKEKAALLRRLFGNDIWTTNHTRVFKNTPYWNELLWRVKDLIELKPLTFPNGEPTDGDIGNVRISAATGECTINTSKLENPLELYKYSDSQNWNLLNEKDVTRRLRYKWQRNNEIQEDAPWTLPHKSSV